MKIRSIVTISLCAVLLLTAVLSFLPSCVPSADSSADFELRIALLESRLTSLQESRAELESKHDSKLQSLESELKLIRDQLDSSAPETDPPAPESEYFGFGYVSDGKEITVTSYKGENLDVVIPATIGGLPVTSIADSAFEGSTIRSVSIPETVESIGWFAFRSCGSLSRAVIPRTVSVIGYDTFSACPKLTVYSADGSYAFKYAKSYGIPVSAE